MNHTLLTLFSHFFLRGLVTAVRHLFGLKSISSGFLLIQLERMRSLTSILQLIRCPRQCLIAADKRSQQLFGLPRMNRMHRMQFDHSITHNLISLVLTICHVKHMQSAAMEKNVLTFDHCRLHSVTFGYYQYCKVLEIFLLYRVVLSENDI